MAYTSKGKLVVGSLTSDGQLVVGVIASGGDLVFADQGSGTGGSTAIVLVVPQGSGYTIRRGGSTAEVIIAPEGSSSIVKTGGSTAEVVVQAEGSGQAIKSSGSTASVIIQASGSGYKKATGSSQASVIVEPFGFGRHIFIDATITLLATRIMTMDKSYLANQSESALLLFSVDSSFIRNGKYAFVDLLLPSGTIVSKGPYEYRTGKFYALITTSDALAYDGSLKLQCVFAEVLDGERRNNKKSRELKTQIRNSV